MDNSELKKILADHKKWLETDGREGEQAYLRWAVLERADLKGADLKGANMQGTVLCGTDLERADLKGANMDYSSWPLWCGSLKAKIDKRLACQLLYHTVRAMQSVDDDECRAVCNDPQVVALANQFHRAEECGKINIE